MRRTGFVPSVAGLEVRQVPAVSLNQMGAFLVIAADAAPQNHNVQVSMVGDKVDVQVDGSDNLFAAGSLATVEFDAGATPAGTTQTFVNNTSLNAMAFGGAGENDFVAGHSWDFFVGGGGVNNFTANDGYVVFFGQGQSNNFTLGTGAGFVLGDSATTTVSLPPASANYWVVTW